MDKNSIKPLEELLASVREIDGFPIGEDEDILALSDPPFYTACPNPYIEEFIKEYGTPYDPENDDYHREPFVEKVSEGKHHPIYAAHTYHTKVPHQAIMKFIEHYTEPGDLVFDGFCGSGMTGVAASLSGRYSIISDISPTATYISYNLLNPLSAKEFEKQFNELIKEAKEECGWMYKTKHTKKALNTRTKEHPNLITEKDIECDINYMVWADLYLCPFCGIEICFGDSSDDKTKPGERKESFFCPDCDAELNQKICEKSIEKKFDSIIQKEVDAVKKKPILVSYSLGTQNFWKKPDEDDLNLIEKINRSEIPYWIPVNQIPEGYNTKQPKKSHGLSYVHQFYTKRNLWVLGKLYELSFKKDLRLWFLVSSLLQKSSKLMALNTDYVARVTKGVLYVSSMRQEINIFYYIKKNIKSLIKAYRNLNELKSEALISTQSSTNLKNIPNNSVDYIFIDPPFGGNIMYSELNYIWESFLKVYTNNKKEAIENNVQRKTLRDYTELMTLCFSEMHRILKSNRWITIEFHNSKASVWNSIQESIARSGFIISQVSVLDKKIGSFKQITSPGAVKNDLIINAYKPEKEFSDRFIKNSGEEMEIDFIKEQLEHIPIQPNIGRTEQMLYPKMLAHYVQNGFKIKFNSTNFYKLLSDNFTELDGYWFTDSQVGEYNEWKSGLSLDQLKEVLDGQQVLVVTDEKSALTWIYNFLNKPKDFSDILSAFNPISQKSDDEIPELREILDNNFIIENGKYRRPLNQQEKEEINENREKELDRAFEKLLNHAKTRKGKIKNIRREAMVHGFTKCYQEGRYQDILTIADKLYASTLESSGEIMDFIDIARIKTSGEE